MSEVKITSSNFDAEVTNSKLPVMVDFWATWCGPCRMLAPFVEEIAEEYAGKLVVGKINVDEEPNLAIKYGINTIPRLILFKDGQAVDSVGGYMQKDEIIETLLQKNNI